MATKCQFGSWPAQSLVSFLVSSSFCKWSWLGKIPQAKIGKACNTAGSVDGVDRGRGLVSKCRALITESHITSYHITSLSHRNAFSRSNLLHTDGFYADMTIVVQKRLKARCRHLCIILGVRHHCRSLHQSRFQHRCQKLVVIFWLPNSSRHLWCVRSHLRKVLIGIPQQGQVTSTEVGDWIKMWSNFGN